METSRPSAPTGELGEIAKMRLELELKKAQLAKEEQQSFGLITTLSSAKARIGKEVGWCKGK